MDNYLKMRGEIFEERSIKFSRFFFDGERSECINKK